ncbi:MAG: hypothetical protein NE330_00165 [Lentisphaeraceae bacterium]|nr:hypothetical protein [Lentisphaeraceae bacterium]
MELDFLLRTNSSFVDQLTVVAAEPAAVFNVIHLRQKHDSGILTKQLLKNLETLRGESKEVLVLDYHKILLETQKVQREIYQFLKAESTKRNKVYTEGMGHKKSYRNLFVQAFQKKRLEEIQEILSKSEAVLALPEPHFFLGASFVLHKNKEREVVGADHEGLLNFISATYGNEKLSNKFKAEVLKESNEKREDVILKNILDSDPNVSYLEPSNRFLILGSAHDLQDNVEKWNKAYPDKKVNLVTFNPSVLNRGEK